MQKSVLVVVEADGWVQRALADGASAEGLEVVACSTARAGFNACCALTPDCLVTALSPHDREGFWLLDALRGRPGEVSATPIIAIAAREPEGAARQVESIRVRALRGGADVVLQKPLDVTEVLAQVHALMTMTSRVRVRRSALPGPDGLELVAGDLDLVPIAGVLATLESSRRSGDLLLLDRAGPARRLSLTISSGILVGGWLGPNPLTPLEALRTALGWEGRRFEFAPGEDQTPPVGMPSIAELLLGALLPPDPATWRASSAPEPDLPELSSRLPPPPRMPAPQQATMPSPGLQAPQAPGRSLVESVRPSARPDPRAEVDG